MKKISIYLLIVLVSLGFSNCVKLTEDPRSNISSGQFYNNPADANSAVVSIYNALSHNTSGDHASIYNRLFTLAISMSTDDHIAGPRATNPDVRSLAALTQSASNDRYSQLWKQHYDGINRANIAIDRIPEIQGDTATTNRLVHEARFLRALLYFNLVRLWGDVPLVLHETTSLANLDVARAPAADVYTQILSDLKDAEKLPVKFTGVNSFRVTSGAAKALELNIYVTRKQWADAISKYNEIKNGGFGYDLFSNYADVFNTATKNGKEHIFSVQYIADGAGNLTGTGNTNIREIISAPIQLNGADADAPHPSLLASFNSKDLRYGVTFYTSLVSPFDGALKSFTPHFKKYFDPASGKNLLNSGVNVPVLRYVESVLFYAEAVNESQGAVSEAYDAINKVRTRAGLPNLTAGLSQDQFRDSVYVERRHEFVYEDIRWFDLIRTKRLVSELKKYADKVNVSEKNYLLAIPQHELSLNPKLTQNPGWE